jgi:hypothetical protein
MVWIFTKRYYSEIIEMGGPRRAVSRAAARPILES